MSNYENSLLLGEELVFISKLIMRASLDSLSKDLTILDVFQKCIQNMFFRILVRNCQKKLGRALF